MLEKDGLVKLVEECGELTQIAAKKMTRMDTDEHWDGAGSLSERMQNEMGDVIAAIRMVAHNFDLDLAAIDKRAVEKFDLFSQWMDEDAGGEKPPDSTPSPLLM